MGTLGPDKIEMLNAFSNCFVSYPLVNTIFNDFDDLRTNRSFQSDSQCMLLTGDTGVGKSHLINEYLRRTLSSKNYGREEIPVLACRISSGKGFNATLIDMLISLDVFGYYQKNKRGCATNLRKKLVNNLIKAKVELLIIYEFQELIEYKTDSERQDIANGLKYISEEAKIPIVLVGMPWAEEIAKEPQWSSRLVRRRKLEYFSLKKNKGLFRDYLKDLSEFLPFEQKPSLDAPEFLIPLFAASKGENRRLSHLLIEALKIALKQNSNTFEIKHAREAYDLIFKNANDYSNIYSNPFTLPPEKVLISEIVQPTRYNVKASVLEEKVIPQEFSTPVTLTQLLTK